MVQGVVELERGKKLEQVLHSKGRIKILIILAKEGELNISGIARMAKVNHNSTSFHLNFLTEAGILQEKRFGRIRIYRFMVEKPRVKAIKNLIDIWEADSL